MSEPTEVVHDAPSMPLAPVDPNVKLPAAAAAAVAKADSYYKAEPVTEAPVKEQGSASLPAPTEHAAVQPGVPDEPTPPPPPSEPTPDYEHMYKSEHGRLLQQQQIANQLAEELHQQQLYNQRMREEIERVKSSPEPKRLVTPEEREAYGEEFFKVVAKTVQEVAGDKLEEIDRLKQQNEALQARLQKTANQTLAQLVSAQVPNWRQLNEDPGFIQWLSLRDIYSMRTRNEMLQEAARRGEAPRIIAFYKGYLAETGQAAQPPSAAMPPPAASRQAAVNLEQLVAPGAPRPATVRPDLAPQKRSYTRAEIAKFYDQKRRGYWAGRDAEWLALERDFTHAATEGRITG